jgi:hypothetical protein
VSWSSKRSSPIQVASQKIQEAFGEESLIQDINQTLTRRWKDLHDDAIDAEPEFNVANHN